MTEPRILIVDDEPDVLDVVGRLLTSRGFKCEVFGNPYDLLQSVNSKDVGCVVTDLEMPGMDGIDVQSKLIELQSCLAVVVITGHADVPRTIQIMSQGAVTLIEKPFSSGQLVIAVERAIEISQHTFMRREKIRTAVELLARLTDEEISIMQLAAQGLPNKAICLQLDISPRTVDRRRQSALAKLNVTSVADFAVLKAVSEEGDV